ncbi:dihydropteroate synthase [Frigoribacterium sp. ACAM 257]|uniref:dihydropteroate synthase n=1 Tax=Frigoribacterium sp. ACAM 257 TaxID=2508998 RepID=UPI001CB9A6A4|nr:dihydropteroate synthase [Frigoribacterium sp. ACAM 257]
MTDSPSDGARRSPSHGSEPRAWKRPRGRERYPDPVVVDAPPPASAPAAGAERRLALSLDERAAVRPPAQLPPVTHTPATQSQQRQQQQHPPVPTPPTGARPGVPPAVAPRASTSPAATGASAPTAASGHVGRRLVVGGRYDGPLPGGDATRTRSGSHAAPGLVDAPAREVDEPGRPPRERTRVASHAAPPEDRAELLRLEADDVAAAAAAAAEPAPAADAGAGPQPAPAVSGPRARRRARGRTDEADPRDVATRAIPVQRPAAFVRPTGTARDDHGAVTVSRTLVMGILNVTPDSFSDGGRYVGLDDALRHARDLVSAGADIVDVGGESTRPGARRVDPVEEQRRVLPVVRELASEGIRLSIDTMNAATAFAAVDAGADVINDVSGGLADRYMAQVAADTGRTFVAMHWRGHLADATAGMRGDDVPGQVRDELRRRVDDLVGAGVDRDQIVLDPGLGFSKDADQNWEVLASLHELGRLGHPMVIGASRKRFLGDLLPDGAEPRDRDAATAVISVLAAQAGVWAVRVHDAASTRAALDVWQAWQRGSGPTRSARHA